MDTRIRMEIGQRRHQGRYINNQIRKDDPKLNYTKRSDSILDLHKIYGKGMTDEEYADWYAVKYGMRRGEVLAVINGLKGEGKWHVQ